MAAAQLRVAALVAGWTRDNAAFLRRFRAGGGAARATTAAASD